MRRQKEGDSKREGSVLGEKKHTHTHIQKKKGPIKRKHTTSTHPGIMGPYKSAKAFTVSK